MNRRTMMQRTAAGVAGLAVARMSPVLAYGLQSTSVLATGAPNGGQTLDPRRFGAKGDGVTLDTPAIQQAIDNCTQAGGGTVHVGPGTYLVGTINLKSNVTLELGDGAKILGSANPNDYSLPAEASAALRGQIGRHVIYAFNAQNITLRGPGIVDGNSSKYFVQVPRPNLKAEEAYRDIVAFGWKRTIGISPMIQLAGCTNVVVDNLMLQNADGWGLQPVGCTKVLIRKVTVRNPIYASNCDGIDPTSCHDVLVTDCDIVTGDDGICVKSYNPYKLWDSSQSCTNVTVNNCRVTTCCNALKVGDEGPNAFQNINFTNCIVHSESNALNERPITGIDIEMINGSSIDGVTFDHITMTNARTPIFIRLQGIGKAPNYQLKGSIQNVTLSNITATGGTVTSSITGLPGLPLRNITLNNIRISSDEQGRPEWVGQPVNDEESTYPGGAMFGRLPAYGLYARHIMNLQMHDIDIQSTTGDPRPVFLHDDVK